MQRPACDPLCARGPISAAIFNASGFSSMTAFNWTSAIDGVDALLIRSRQ